MHEIWTVEWENPEFTFKQGVPPKRYWKSKKECQTYTKSYNECLENSPIGLYEIDLQKLKPVKLTEGDRVATPRPSKL